MIPPIVTIIPLFIFFHFMDLVNTKTSLIIAYTTFNLPFVVWMMRGYFHEIPRELEESAMVDGDTGFGGLLAHRLAARATRSRGDGDFLHDPVVERSSCSRSY